MTTPFLSRALLLALGVPVTGWVTTSQSLWGASLDIIQGQMRGEAIPEGVNLQGTLGQLWTYNPDGKGAPDGSDLQSTEMLQGLGGGITWAWDPALCDSLLPKFSEKTLFITELVNCDSLKAAVIRAFGRWEASSRFIKLIDVSAECEMLGLDYGPPTGKAHERMAQDHREEPMDFHGGCPLAEIWVTSLDSSERRRRQLAEIEAAELPVRKSGDYFSATHELYPADVPQRRLSEGGTDVAVATALTYYRRTKNFYFTNGERPFYNHSGTTDYDRYFVEAYAGKMSIAVDGTVGGVSLCWYLDSDFCSELHRLKRYMGSPAQAKALVQGLCYALSFLSFLILCFTWLHIVKAFLGYQSAHHKHADKDGDGRLSLHERWSAGLEALSDVNPLVFAVLFTCFAGPLVVYAQILLPCWSCNDFEAAILHETGHFFGLGHPGNVPNELASADLLEQSGNPTGGASHVYNTLLAADTRLDATTCRNVWEYVAEGTPSDAEDVQQPGQDGYLGEYPVRNSVMEAFTQHNPKACLTKDDVEAFATLYPDCSEVAISANVCIHVQHNIGRVRVALYVFVPMIAALIFVVLLSTVSHNYVKREMHQERARASTLQESVNSQADELEKQTAYNKALRATIALKKGASNMKWSFGSFTKKGKDKQSHYTAATSTSSADAV